jgi:hypothetical protein
MTSAEFFLIALKISFASLGFRAVTSKGMIFYFMRRPFDRLSVKKEAIDKMMIRTAESEGYDAIKFSEVLKTYLISFVIYLMKPVLLCAPCMASVHSLIWFPFWTGKIDVMIIPMMLTVAFLNAFLWLFVENMKAGIADK